MKNSAVLFLILLLSVSVFAQRTTTKKPTPTPAAVSEKEEFDKAAALADAGQRITAFQNFMQKFPDSEQMTRVRELIVSARAQIGDDKLAKGEKESGIESFKAAIADAPVPMSDELFGKIVLQIPTNLFVRGERLAANEIAKAIEEKIGENAKQIVGLASFYLGTENSAKGKELAIKAIGIDPNLPSAYQTLGLANRMGFMLDDAAAAYIKALELDNTSAVSKRSLADIKRGMGKSEEAITLYREILAADATDGAAQTGLILALFDTGKKTEAEAELTKSLEANPNNLFLLVGTAYWYAAAGNGEKAVEYAQRALILEPRYTWAHIALARGLLVQKKPLEAERILLTAKQYGDFPTLDYEIATVRMEAGFYREAAEILRRSFRFGKDNYIRARLGGRVSLEAMTFSELLGAERRASIFQPLAADTEVNSDRMKTLLDLSEKLDAANATEEQIIEAVDKFIGKDDAMKFYRQIFAVRQLVRSKKALPKALEIIQSAIPKVDAALTVQNPAAAVLADALYETRAYSISRNQLVIVPDLPRQTLSNILRGEIEELAGWTLFQQNKSADAVLRLKRALSILPEKSVWWRSSWWRLGTALEADGKSEEALDAYIKSYTNEAPNLERYNIIEALYQKVKGNTDGLEKLIGAKPNSLTTTETVAQVTPTPTPVNEALPVATPTPSVEIQTPKTETSPTPIVQTSPTPAEKTEETKTEETKTEETKPQPTPSPSEEKIETKTDEKPAETAQVSNKETKTENKPENKPLFEPVIITIPNNNTNKETPKTENKPAENAKTEETDKSNEKPVDQNTDSGETRQRRVTPKTEEAKSCAIVANQDNISILNGGGTIVLMVGFAEAGDLKTIKAVSSSPNDVEITLDTEFGEKSGRILYVIKSISTNKGTFTITFEAPCGKKEVAVNVR